MSQQMTFLPCCPRSLVSSSVKIHQDARALSLAWLTAGWKSNGSPTKTPKHDQLAGSHPRSGKIVSVIER
jgi:hypothetical protein